MKFEPIEDFLARARKLNKASKEMRLSFEEATMLAISIGELLSQLNKKSAEAPASIQVDVIDGGTFPKRG